MREILLTQNRITLVDDDDYKRLSQFKWCANWDGKNWYALRGIRVKGKVKLIRMHREILNVPAGMQIDHRNGNGLDNCRENLRLCTNQQNACNRKHPQKNNKLGIKGVSCHKWNKKFQARICINGKPIHLGYFNVLGDADSAYRIAEEKYFGEYARELA